MFPVRPEPHEGRCWGKSVMVDNEGRARYRGFSTPLRSGRNDVSFRRRQCWLIVALVACCVWLAGCKGRVEAPGTVVMIIESSPNNLDLRQGTDAQSERIGGLIFDALVRKDEDYNLQ